ncbi:hypothetical protein [Brevibacillus sp. SYSU BS000544]|uniref:hypothetical protein n=1 Tax=Brevibacillus sp. SYSU BS000544 TaxID=3416443 RepID=UPI003CE480E9
MKWVERISQLRRQIMQDTQELAQLEEQYKNYLKQLELRKTYMSSREIIELVASYQGITKNMTAIKRWADEGLLGEKIDEREYFPLLVKKQGNKRFLFPRSAVYAFLASNNYIFPRFEIIDQVKYTRLNDGKKIPAVIISVHLHKDQFEYTIQEESTGELIHAVREVDLELVEEDA